MTREVPKEQWKDYLESVSAEYQGRPVTVLIENEDIGSEVLVEGRPLIGIEPDLPKNTIIIIAGDPQGAEPQVIRHFITNPDTIYAQQDDLGATKNIDFESQEEGKTLLTIG